MSKKKKENPFESHIQIFQADLNTFPNAGIHISGHQDGRDDHNIVQTKKPPPTDH